MTLSELRPLVLVVSLCGLAPLLGDSVEGASGEESAAAEHSECVVLLHGLGRSALSMKRLEWGLRKQGYRVMNVSYPSTRLSVEAAAARLDEVLSERTPDSLTTIHFVTHSLGGIVLRQYLATHKLTYLGRVVMLAPPNQGSELADRLKDNILFRFATGPAGRQLGTDSSSLPTRLGPADFDLGVIAGDRSLNPLFSAWIPGPDDGKVSVESTRLNGMRVFLIVHHTHTWMMWRTDVIGAVVGFLQVGRFDLSANKASLPLCQAAFLRAKLGQNRESKLDAKTAFQTCR